MSNKITFPIITENDDPYYPRETECPICGSDRTKLDKGFLVLNGGALQIVDEDLSTISGDLEGFFSLIYHGKGDESSIGGGFDIVDTSLNGQFEIYFCSPDCLQTFIYP